MVKDNARGNTGWPGDGSMGWPDDGSVGWPNSGAGLEPHLLPAGRGEPSGEESGLLTRAGRDDEEDEFGRFEEAPVAALGAAVHEEAHHGAERRAADRRQVRADEL